MVENDYLNILICVMEVVTAHLMVCHVKYIVVLTAMDNGVLIDAFRI